LAISLKQILDFPPQAQLETCIGTLSLFSMKVADHRDILKSIAEGKEKDPKEYFKMLLLHICYPTSQLREGKFRPNEPVLTADDVSKLPDEELEQIAETFLEHSVYLYKKSEIRNEKNSDNKEVASIAYTEVEHPKLKGESNVEYVFRLEQLKQEKERKRYESILNSFPTNLSESIAKTYSMGSAVSDAFERVKAAAEMQRPMVKSVPSFMAETAELLRIQEDNRRAPFHELGQRLDALVDLSQKAYEYNRNTFEVQTEIARDIKSGGETTGRYAKYNIGLTIFVILLTIIIAAWSNFSGVTFSDEQQQTLGKYTATVSTALEDNAKAMERGREVSLVALQDIVSALHTLNRNMDSRQVSMDTLKAEINELKKNRQDDQRKIEVLEAELSALKAIKTP
jgi:hypothetical protein